MSTCRPNGLQIFVLADHVASLLGHKVPTPSLLHDELITFVESLGIELTDSGCPQAHAPATRGDPLTDAAETLAAKLQGAEPEELFEGDLTLRDVGNGTGSAPLEMPRRSRVPLSEFRSKGYMTLAFPTLFPNGRGYFEEQRDHPLKWEQWAQHLMYFHDGRFATHRRFPFFLHNTHERAMAIQKAGVFVKRDPQAGRLTYGQLRALSNQTRDSIFQRLSSFGATLRNTPAFFKQRRHELRAMIEQLGDPHVFATNSHADTYCPYLQRFIMAGAQIAKNSERDPFVDGLTLSQRYKRRLANVVAYPHLTAQFFHLKTELFFSHIGEALDCEAHWCRYEWQSRGSTHAHYFLWLKGAPDLFFLDVWVKEELRNLGNDCQLTEDVVQQLLQLLNKRATAALDFEPQGGWLSDIDGLSDANGNVPEEVQAVYAAQWWARQCGRLNRAWDENEKRPYNVGDVHPSSEPHIGICQSCDEQHQAAGATDAPNSSFVECTEQLARLLNKNNRHTTHYPSYCIRRDKHGKEFCRFGFPNQPHERNVPHFYFELVRNKDGSPKGVRAQLYLPMNDPLMNITNDAQAASQRANVDFKPLIDHFSALEYSTKYATKQEKGSKAFDKLIALALNGGGRADPDAQGRLAKGSYASFLVQQTGGRDWSAQEVAHVTSECIRIITLLLPLLLPDCCYPFATPLLLPRC